MTASVAELVESPTSQQNVTNKKSNNKTNTIQSIALEKMERTIERESGSGRDSKANKFYSSFTQYVSFCHPFVYFSLCM